MPRLTKPQKQVMLALDNANAEPGPVSMDVVRELVGLGLISKSGDDHLEFTAKGEKAISQLHAAERKVAEGSTPSSPA